MSAQPAGHAPTAPNRGRAGSSAARTRGASCFIGRSGTVSARRRTSGSAALLDVSRFLCSRLSQSRWQEVASAAERALRSAPDCMRGTRRWKAPWPTKHDVPRPLLGPTFVPLARGRRSTLPWRGSARRCGGTDVSTCRPSRSMVGVARVVGRRDRIPTPAPARHSGDKQGFCHCA